MSSSSSTSHSAGRHLRLAPRIACCALGMLILSWSPSASAQSVKDADAAWSALKSYGRPLAAGAKTGKRTRTELVSTFIAQADQLKSFYAEHPGHASAREAKRLEAMALAHAALNGDSSQTVRRLSLLESVRRDEGLPALARFEAVAWSRQAELALVADKSRPAHLAGHAAIARALIAEFPAVPDGYESLSGVARLSAPDEGRKIAQEVIAMPQAPAHARASAQLTLERFALLGRPALPLFAAAGAGDLLSGTTGKRVVIYTWSASAPSSVAAIKRLLEKVGDVAAVGICLDADVAAATRAAGTLGAPGRQYYHPSGRTSPLVNALKLSAPREVYLLDRQGSLHDVQAIEDLAAKLSQAK